MSKKKLNSKKAKKILLIAGLGLVGLELIVSIIMMVILGKLSIIPRDYVIMIDILLVLFCIIFLISQKWTIAGIITKGLSLIVTAALIVGCVYLNTTYGVFKKTTGVKHKTITVSVYVLKENNAESIEDLKNEKFGIVANIGREETDDTIKRINEECKTNIETVEYEDSVKLAEALINKEVNVIIMDDSFSGIFEEVESLKNFNNLVKVVSSFHSEKEIEEDTKNDKYLQSEDVITFYVSGVDVDGPPTSNRNSDVNILMTMNLKTHQIFLLNTPRDFYIPIAVSAEGEMDKLTHAGCHGVDCSVQSLERFYGIDIDYYIKLNFTGFVSIIDSLGGIDVYSEFEFTSLHGGDHFVVGMNHMTGKQALGFARERYSFPSGDNQRGRNQMAVINAVITKLASSELLKNYTEVLNSLSSCIVTDMTMEKMGKIVDLQLKNGISWDIVQFAVGGKGANLPCYTLPGHAANYVMIPDENLVNLAKDYLKQIHDNKIITIQ